MSVVASLHGPALLRREQLLAQIWPEHQPRALLVIAPSGYGKSVFLAQAAEHAPHSVQLDLGESAGGLDALTGELIDAVEVTDAHIGLQMRGAHALDRLTPRRAAALLGTLPQTLVTVDHAERLGPDGEAWLLGAGGGKRGSDRAPPLRTGPARFP